MRLENLKEVLLERLVELAIDNKLPKGSIVCFSSTNAQELKTARFTERVYCHEFGRPTLELRNDLGERFTLVRRPDRNVWIEEQLYEELFGKSIKSTEKKPFMDKIIDRFRELTASKEEKLLKRLGIEDPIGTPTDLGLRLAAEIAYKENREKVIEAAKKIEADENDEKKG